MSDFIPATPEDLNEMSKAGAPPEVVEDYRQKSIQDMAHNSVPEDQILSYYGLREPDMTPVKRHVSGNIKRIRDEESKTADGKPKEKEPTPHLPGNMPEEATTILQGLEAGWGTSFAGLYTSAKKSPYAISDNSSRAVKIASMVAQFAGDIPAMAAGMVAGGAVGAGAGTVTVPVLGTISGAAVGAMAGGFAAPAAMRKMLMDQQENGEVTSVGDFTDRLVAASWEGMKGAATGVATALVGGPAGAVAAKAGGAYVGTIGKLAAEASTMATVSSALEGHLPSQEELENGLIVIGGFHALGQMPKLRNIYAKTGLKPEDIVEKTESDPVAKQEVLGAGTEIPESLKPLEDPAAKEPEPKAKEDVLPEGESEELKAARAESDKWIGEKGEKEKQGYSAAELYRDMIDSLDPVLQVEGDEPAATSGYKLMRMLNDIPSKVKAFVEKHTYDFNTFKKTGESLKTIIDPIAHKLDRFQKYLIAERVLELKSRGIDSKFDFETAKQIVAADRAEFGETAKKVGDYQNRVMEFLRDSGRISNDAFEAMKKLNKHYIPFDRIMEMDEAAGKGGKSKSLKRIGSVDEATQLSSPFLAVLNNTKALLKLAETNRARVSFVDNALKETGILEKIPAKDLKMVDAAPEVNKFLEDMGLANEVKEFKVFRAQDHRLAPNEIEIFRKGKREVYKVNDRVLAESLKSLDGNPASQNIILRLARFASAVKRVGITMTAEFVAKNSMRDFLTARVFSKYGALGVSDIVVAMKDLWHEQGAEYDAFLKSGGAGGAFLKLENDYLQKNVFGLNEQTGFIDAQHNVLSKIKDIIRLAEKIGNTVEQAPRFAEFKRAVKGAQVGEHGELVGREQITEGGFAAREITVDFQRMGLKTQALNSIAVFMNAQLQGVDRTGRALGINEAIRSGEAWLKPDWSKVNKELLTKAAFVLTGPTLLLWAAQKDDPRYQEIPAWQRDLFWCVVYHDWQPYKNEEEIAGLPEYMVKDGKVDRGTIFRIPKPQELGLMFATLPERLAEAFLTDHPDAMKGFMSTVQSIATPNWKPDALIPLGEQMMNYNDFTSRPLIPQYLEKELPAYRYTEYTSDTARALGKLLGTVPVIKETTGASPIVIENYIKAWTGQWGSYVLQLADAGVRTATGAPSTPTPSLSDIPFVKAFVVRNPSTQAESIQRFYDRATKLEQIITTSKRQMRKGSFGDVEYISEHYGDPIGRVDGVRKTLSSITQLIRSIADDDRPVEDGGYTKADKRQLIESQYYGMIEVAKMGNLQIDEMEKAMKNVSKGEK